MREEIEKYVRNLGLDAYLVGGAVRDELLGLDSKDADFLVPGLDTEGLRSALAPHGRVEDLVVADRLVDGTDSAHVLEAIFKALGAALAQACEPMGGIE